VRVRSLGRRPLARTLGGGRSILTASLALLALLVAACAGTPQTPVGAYGNAALLPTVAASASAASQTPPPPPAIQAKIAYLLDPETGAVYLARGIDSEVAMASTTKIMTALVAISYGKLDGLITVGADALLPPSEASLAFLRQGDRLTLRDLLYGLLLPSGDDAAVAIADGVAGSQANFVALMNMEAALLGLTHTHYTDVHGLDPAACDYTALRGFNPGCHYTTARDLAHLAAFAMHSPLFARIVSTPLYNLAADATHGDYLWQTTNKLLSVYAFPGIAGIKTGFTGAAGHCLVSAAVRPYGHLLSVVLNDGDASTDPTVFTDSAALLEWGFAQQAAAAQHWVSIPPENAP
jgi:serine-type D-Ala-D-Ala carboxypeptidase (penicillin-binding protein 5/6)